MLRPYRFWQVCATCARETSSKGTNSPFPGRLLGARTIFVCDVSRPEAAVAVAGLLIRGAATRRAALDIRQIRPGDRHDDRVCDG